MSTVISKKLNASFERRCKRAKMQYSLTRNPDTACEKCGAAYWDTDIDGEWFCFTCGNRGYWSGDDFVQAYRKEKK